MIKVVINEEQNVKFFDSILRQVGKELIERMQEQLEEKDAIATGYLYSSFDIEVEGMKAVLRNEAPYSEVLEFGCVPHRPPYDEILNWVRIKKQEEGERAADAAWRIVKKIEREGYEGRFYARDALRVLTGRVRRL